MVSTLNGADGRLRLADHVRACHVDGQVALLDLLRGRYIGLGGKQVAGLCGAIDGWASGELPPGELSPPAVVNRLVRPLLTQGLLTRAPVDRSPLPDIEKASHSLDINEAMGEISASPRDLCRFLRTAAVASLSLRWRSTHANVNSVASQRVRRSGATDDARLRQAMAIYEKLRPLVFTARDQCLFDSLTLIHFLAAEGLFPSWVIGVKTSPFRAHSCVQAGDLVLNDLHENVLRFKPILVV